jgi:DNA-binding response OmpR family regulator
MSRVAAHQVFGAHDALRIEVEPWVENELAQRALATGLSLTDLTRGVFSDWLLCSSPAAVINVGAVELNPEKRSAVIDGRAVHLSPLENRVLGALALRAGQMVSLEELALLTWGPGRRSERRALAIHVCRLRDKLGPAISIRGDRGHGYQLDVASASGPVMESLTETS